MYQQIAAALRHESHLSAAGTNRPGREVGSAVEGCPLRKCTIIRATVTTDRGSETYEWQ